MYTYYVFNKAFMKGRNENSHSLLSVKALKFSLNIYKG